MSRTTLGILIGLPAAIFIAWQQGGRVGTGVITGFLLGASLFGLGHAWQRHVVARRPQDSMKTLAVLGILKLVVLLASWAVLNYVPAVSDRVHTKACLLAYVTTVLLVSFVGSYDAMLIIKNRKAQTS